jgi:EAL domain-containing protein (putative c-di-GMP-specific phosphodiesterase class I)
VLAEGVESSEHFAILKDCGCDLMQGYYFSRPIPYEELCQYLAASESIQEQAEPMV